MLADKEKKEEKEEEKLESLWNDEYLFSFLPESERKCTVQPQDAPGTMRRALRLLQCEHDFIDNKKMNTAVRCK